MTQYATVWRDLGTLREGLLTYSDRNAIALRTHDEVTRAVPSLTVLSDDSEGRAHLEAFLRNKEDTSTLAVPESLVRDILGWDL